MANRNTTERVQCFCWKAAILAVLVMAFSPRIAAGVVVLAVLLLLCVTAQVQPHGTDDAVSRKA